MDDSTSGGGKGVFVLAIRRLVPPAVVPAPVVPAADVSARIPATAEPIPVAATEPTAMAVPATKPLALTRSPPESAGDPPRTAANNLGICQHNIMKMMEAPIISNADMAGLELLAMF